MNLSVWSIKLDSHDGSSSLPIPLCLAKHNAEQQEQIAAIARRGFLSTSEADEAMTVTKKINVHYELDNSVNMKRSTDT